MEKIAQLKAYTHISVYKVSSNIKWQFKRPLLDTIAQLKACTLPLLKASTHIHNQLLFVPNVRWQCTILTLVLW